MIARTRRFLLLPHHVRLYEVPDHRPAVLNVIEGPSTREDYLPRVEHQHDDHDVGPAEYEAREDVALVGGVDVVALVYGLDVEDLALPDPQLGVGDDVLDLEVDDPEPLPDAHPAEQAAHVVG